MFKNLTTERLAFWILFLLLFMLAVRTPVDTDTWWHLRSGEYMVENGELLQEDRFSHTRNGNEWINHSWASQIVMYSAYQLTGGNSDPGDTGTIGLALFMAILATGGMAVLYQMCAGNIYPRMFALILGAATAGAFWSARPQMVSFFLSTVILFLLYLFKYRRINRLWFIPLLMILWVNLHGGFAIGFIFLLGFMIGEATGNLFNPEDEYAVDWQRLRTVLIVTIVSIFALSINPYGPRMIFYPFETAGLATLNQLIQEWRSPDFKSPISWPYVVLLIGTIILAARTRKPIAWSDLALFTGTALMALWASRNIAVFAVVATPIFSRQLDSWLSQQNWQVTPVQTVSKRMLLINRVLLALVVLGVLGQIVTVLNSEAVEEDQARTLPVHVTEFLKENPQEGPMLNDYNWGGYFVFALRDYPVFVDGRTDLYNDDFLRDYFRAILGHETWRKPLVKYDIQLIVVQDSHPLVTLLRESPDVWEIIYEETRDEEESVQAIVFRRLEDRVRRWGG